MFSFLQGAWFVRSEVQQAKDEGLLPDDFVAQDNGTIGRNGGQLGAWIFFDVVFRSVIFGILHH